MNRTIEHIRKGFNGHFLWADPPIIIKTEISLPKEKKSLDEDIKYLLKSNAQKLIDWKSCINELESRFSDRKGGFIQLKAEKEDGSELFISLLEYLFLGSIGNIGIDKPRPLVVLNLGVLNVFHQYDEII